MKWNDRVDVVAPGSGLPREVLAKSEKFLQSWGLQCRIPKGLLQPTLLHSNSDEARFQFLKQALLSKDSSLVWCLRGGYGSNRLIPALMKLPKPKHKKIFIGISDVTSIHLFLTQEWGWSTYHGSLLDRLAQGTLPQKCKSELQQILFGEVSEIEFSLRPLNQKAKDLAKSGVLIKSEVTGGNLMTLQSSLGTDCELDTKGKLLFIEEIGERGYRVDRMLEQLKQNGKFQNCRGLLIGHFVGGAEADGRYVWKNVLQDWAKNLNIPVYSGLESGHGEMLRTLPFGTRALLTGKKIKICTGIR